MLSDPVFFIYGLAKTMSVNKKVGVVYCFLFIISLGKEIFFPANAFASTSFSSLLPLTVFASSVVTAHSYILHPKVTNESSSVKNIEPPSQPNEVVIIEEKTNPSEEYFTENHSIELPKLSQGTERTKSSPTTKSNITQKPPQRNREFNISSIKVGLTLALIVLLTVATIYLWMSGIYLFWTTWGYQLLPSDEKHG